MVNGKIVAVVLPAYNAESTLEITYSEIPQNIVDEVIICDDCSKDNTVDKAKELGIRHIIRHERNLGYGGNQKSCYNKALSIGADIVVMLHPDYQYTPKLIEPMVSIIANGVFPAVFGSRILGVGALRGGMPVYKYVCNRFLTFLQNLLMGQKLSEYHTGYRAFSADLLRSIDYNRLSDNFVFDNQIIAQIFSKSYEIGEITCPTKYFEEASSINLKSSIRYGFGVLNVSIRYFLDRIKLLRYDIIR